MGAGQPPRLAAVDRHDEEIRVVLVRLRVVDAAREHDLAPVGGGLRTGEALHRDHVVDRERMSRLLGAAHRGDGGAGEEEQDQGADG